MFPTFSRLPIPQNLNPDNPYIRNDRFYSNVTINESELLYAKLHRLNWALSSIFGVSCVCVFLWLLIKRTPVFMRPYSRILMLCCAADVCQLCSQIVSGARLRTNQGIILSQQLGLVSLFRHNFEFHVLAECFENGSYALVCTILPAQYYFRLYIVKEQRIPTFRRIFGISFLSFLGAFAVGVGTHLNLWNSFWWCRAEGFDYASVWAPMDPMPILLVGEACSPYMMAHFVLGGLMIVGSYGLALLIAHRTYSGFSAVPNLSDRNTRLLTQLSRLLFVQSMAPLFLVILPASFTVVGVYANANFGDIPTLIFMNWFASFNSVASMVLITPYRRALIDLCHSVGIFVGIRERSKVMIMVTDVRGLDTATTAETLTLTDL